MPSFPKWPGAALVGLLLSLCATPAATSGDAKPNRVEIAYLPPKNPAHQAIHDEIKRAALLDPVREILSIFRLPRTLLIKTEGCDGEINAWFENDAITLCYEYLEWIGEVAAKRRAPLAASPTGARIGPFLELVIHEAAHALFAYLDTPIFGREEDAADRLAALILLAMPPEKAKDMLAGIANVYLDEAGFRSTRHLKRRRLGITRAAAQADEHSLPLQRMYNLLCLAYGSNEKEYDMLVTSGLLPKERAEGCADEYRQTRHAFARLLAPHLDQEAAERVKARFRLQFPQ